jgi:hypothetical protein
LVVILIAVVNSDHTYYESRQVEFVLDLVNGFGPVLEYGIAFLWPVATDVRGENHLDQAQVAKAAFRDNVPEELAHG